MVRFTLTTIVLATLYVSSISAIEESNVCEKSLKVTSQGDLDSIKSCKTFTGNIELNTVPAGQLSLEGVEELIGDLIMTANPDLMQFSAPQLSKVAGHLRIENHLLLNKLELPKLSQVDHLWLSVLPALNQIQFPSGLTQVKTARFEDTHAPTIEGFKPETIESFSLLANKLMQSFDFNSVKEVTGELVILGNNPAMTFNANQLSAIQKATFFNLNQLDLPSLTSVRDDLSFHENDFGTLALDHLADIGGTMTIANNNQLTELSFKELKLIKGALSIGNNSQLATITGFPVLSDIHGMVDLAGSFQEYNLPALQDVRGGMKLQTTSDKFGCPEIERKLKGQQIVKGDTWSCSASMEMLEMEPTVGQSPDTEDILKSSPSNSDHSKSIDSSKGKTDNKNKSNPVAGAASAPESATSNSNRLEQSPLLIVMAMVFYYLI